MRAESAVLIADLPPFLDSYQDMLFVLYSEYQQTLNPGALVPSPALHSSYNLGCSAQLQLHGAAG